LACRQPAGATEAAEVDTTVAAAAKATGATITTGAEDTGATEEDTTINATSSSNRANRSSSSNSLRQPVPPEVRLNFECALLGSD